MHMASSSVPLVDVARIRALPGVTWADPILYAPDALSTAGTEQLTYVIGYVPGGRGGAVSLAAGRGPEPGEIVVDERAARNLGLAVGRPVRILGRTDSTQSMMFWMTAMMSMGATALAWPTWQPIAPAHYPILAGIAVTGAVGQWGITVAFKHAPAASVAPLEYTGLAWVTLIDIAVWSAFPSARTLLGAAIIIACGVFLIRSEARSVTSSAS